MDVKQKGKRLKALKAAFPHTIPILAGFGFLGIAYGILMNVSGFSFWYPLLISIIVFGGSLQFVMVTMLLSAFAPVQTLIMALLVQVRHLFYGIAMLDKYKGLGWKRFYLILGLCDETFSINCSIEPPEDVDKGWFMLFVTMLNRLYWITGSLLGGLLGSLIEFNTEGLDFAMSAMFVVILLEQLIKEKSHISSIIGLAASIICLIIFGADSFMIPTMITILCLLTFLRKPIEKAGDPI
ncbi:MAG: branched-chain amino acid transporter AzlC [Ruminococcaceae bacterium]|nr:branched-chain amino acid transporter AzlC [Oscillospiraceae bacterium]